MASCSIKNSVVKQINSEFKTQYPEIKSYSKTEYQEKLRNRILPKFLNDYKLTNSNLYVVEAFQNRGGHHVVTKYQTVFTYFWQDGEILEVYYVDDNDELKLNFIEEQFKRNDLDSIRRVSENLWKHQFSHAGEYFITELDNNLNILKSLKCTEFAFE